MRISRLLQLSIGLLMLACVTEQPVALTRPGERPDSTNVVAILNFTWGPDDPDCLTVPEMPSVALTWESFGNAVVNGRW